jgi:transcriptional regulator with XRE-family HTH domain/tetratricopeptide (TPR) repeat protein
MTDDPAQLPDEQWDHPDVLAALEGRDIAALFGLVHRYGWSQTVIGVRCGMSQSEVSRIRNGKRQVEDLEVFARIAKGLAMPDRALVRLLGGDRARDQPAHESPAHTVDRPHGTDLPSVPATPGAQAYSEGWVHPPDSPDADDSPGRRIFMAADETFQFIVNAERAAPAAEVVDLLQSEVRRLVAAYPKESMSLTGPLLGAQRAAFRLLDGPGVPDQARDLYFLAAVTSGLLAHAGVDLSQFHAAHLNARAAYLCADRAGHPGLRTWIRIEQARIAYWSGSPREALRYLSLAHPDADTVTGSMPISLATQEARAYAALGDTTQTMAAITRAHNARDRTRPDDLDEIAGELANPLSVQLTVTADALALLPDYAQAERAAAEAVREFETQSDSEVSYGNRAAAQINLAVAHIRQGEVDGARAALGPVFSITPAQRTHGMRSLMRRVHRSLSAPGYVGSAVARDTATQIEAYCDTLTPVRLPE